MRGALDGAVKIEFVRRAGAREFAQAAKCDLDIARAELDVAGEILEFAFVPDLHRAEIAVLVLTNAHALRIVTVGAERRSARRADPLLAALMAAALFGEPLPQYFEKLVETA